MHLCFILSHNYTMGSETPQLLFNLLFTHFWILNFTLENCVLDLCNRIYPFHILFRLAFHSELTRLFTNVLLLFLPGVKFSLSGHLLSWIINMLFTSVPTSTFPLGSLFFLTFTEHSLLISSSACSIIPCLFFFFFWKATKRTSGYKSCESSPYSLCEPMKTC